MHKKSKLRDGIEEVLMREDFHPTADDIYMLMKEEYPDIGIATVYRNLDQLVKMGKVRRLGVPEGSACYELNMEKHYHVRCRNCGRVKDVMIDFDVADHIDLNTIASGFEFVDYDIVFEGICRDCIEKRKD